MPASPNLPPPPQRLRLRVTATAESILRSGHPWLFADSIREQNREGALGELAVVYDRQDKFLAIGLFDPDSPIRLRVLHAGKPQTLDKAWWQGRLRMALGRRAGLFDQGTTGHRWINGESDGWPGLVLDRYETTLVLKLYTGAWLPRLSEITAALGEELQPERLVLRLSRNIQEMAANRFALKEGYLPEISVRGAADAVEVPTIFLENGLRFEAEVLRGQKTGFFLDQRENRRRIETLSSGREVLNAFSFSGGFSVYAARGGARSVLDLDISAHALEGAARNFALNQSEPAVARCRRSSVQADAFRWLDDCAAQTFDLIVLDPPSLARRESERAGAIQAYTRLAQAGLRILRRGGILAAASCSAHVSSEEFFKLVRTAAAGCGRRFLELGITGHPPDHPAGFPEAHYLKCVYLKEESRGPT